MLYNAFNVTKNEHWYNRAGRINCTYKETVTGAIQTRFNNMKEMGKQVIPAGYLLILQS
jgi:hypothetical protein